VQVLPISFADVARGNTRHQCVLLKCNNERRLMQAAATAEQTFGAAIARPYNPHCSLLYSDIEDSKRCGIFFKDKPLKKLHALLSFKHMNASVSTLFVWTTDLCRSGTLSAQSRGHHSCAFHSVSTKMNTMRASPLELERETLIKCATSITVHCSDGALMRVC
jgi:hypothetical protein